MFQLVPRAWQYLTLSDDSWTEAQKKTVPTQGNNADLFVDDYDVFAKKFPEQVQYIKNIEEVSSAQRALGTDEWDYHRVIFVKRTVPSDVLVLNALETSSTYREKTTIMLAPGVEVSIVDRTAHKNNSLRSLSAFLHPGATLYLSQEYCQSSYSYSWVDLYGAQDSSIHYFSTVIDDSDCVAQTIRCVLHERGAQAHIGGFYIGRDNQQVAMQTEQVHHAPHTQSSLVINGALTDSARAAFCGTIAVGEHSRNAQAHQTNKTILCGAQARAVSIPNLEVKTHEVVCQHGSAVGQLDEQQRAYLQARGLCKQEANKLLLQGFLESSIVGATQKIQDLIPKKALCSALEKIWW